jgi:hypothetical protein
MAGGGTLDFSQRENQDMGNPEYRRYLEQRQALEPDYTDVDLAVPVLRGLAGAAGMAGRAMAPAAAGPVIKKPIGWELATTVDEILGKTPINAAPAVFIPRTAEEIAAAAARKIPAKAKKIFMEDIPRNVAAAAGDLAAIVNRYQDSQKKADGGSFTSDVPNEDWLRENVEYAKSKKRDQYGVPYMGKVTGRFKDHVKIPVSILAKLKGMRGEQENVRKEDLDWLVNHMGKTGKLPLTDRGEEYAPFVTVDHEGTPWVSEGNHRIMAAQKLGWSHLPVEVRYFDGGERANGPLHPDKIMEKPVKKADGGTAKPMSQDAMILALTKNKMGMHSPLEKAAINVPRTKGTAQEFMTEMQKQPGFRAEELADRPIQPREGKMTKEEFVKHVKSQKGPQIEVEHRYAEDDQTHHEEWTHPGGDNYREILLKRPAWQGNDRIMEKEAQLRRVGSDVMRDVYQRELDELRASKEKHGEVFPGVSAHFGGEPGIVASLRVKDRQGPRGEKIYHIEEIQSDWHQRGRKQGYRGSVDQQALKDKEKNLAKERGSLVREFVEHEAKFGQISPEMQERWNEFKARENALNQKKSELASQAPDAPHKKSWHELALKHALTEAAKGGYHGIAITPGEQQADRYDLSKHIDALSFKPEKNGLGILEAWDKNRVNVLRKIVPSEEVPNYIGKEAAQRLLAAEPVMGKHLLENEDLKIGGEGMKGFYDKIVVDFLNKLGKKHGAAVGRVPLNLAGRDTSRDDEADKLLDDLGVEVPKVQAPMLHYFPITDSLRKQIKTEGLPQYADGGDVE